MRETVAPSLTWRPIFIAGAAAIVALAGTVLLGPLQDGDGVLRNDPGGSYRVLRLTECLS